MEKLKWEYEEIKESKKYTLHKWQAKRNINIVKYNHWKEYQGNYILI